MKGVISMWQINLLGSGDCGRMTLLLLTIIGMELVVVVVIVILWCLVTTNSSRSKD